VSNISKMIGAAVGGFLTWVVATFALPAVFAGPEATGALTTIISLVVMTVFPSITTFFAPKNTGP